MNRRYCFILNIPDAILGVLKKFFQLVKDEKEFNVSYEYVKVNGEKTKTIVFTVEE